MVILIKTVTCQENKSTVSQRPDCSNREHSENKSSVDQVSDSIKQRFVEPLKIVASIYSSTIVLINLQDEKRNSSLISHSFFFLLILFENIVLVCLPFMVPARYPDWFPLESCIKTVRWVIVLWLVGVAAHIVHYKWAHPLALLNGPEMSLASMHNFFHWKQPAPDRYVKRHSLILLKQTNLIYPIQISMDNLIFQFCI